MQSARGPEQEDGRTGSFVVYDHNGDILRHDWVWITLWISVRVYGSGSGVLTSIRAEAPFHELVLYRILRKKRVESVEK